MTPFLAYPTAGKYIDGVLQEEEEPDFTDVPVALLTFGPDPFSCEKFSVIVEGNIVFRDIPRISEAVILLFGLIYAFNLEYPKNLTHTFTCIQKIFVCLDDGKPLKPCLLTLKHDLLFS